MPKPISDSKKEDIRSAILENRSFTEIAESFGIHPSTVGRYAKRFSMSGTARKGGRPIVVPASTRKYVRLLILKGDLQTARDVHLRLLELGFSMSYTTAINILKKMNFHAKLKKKKPLLTKKHMQKRLAWAKKHRNWTIDQWRQVIFSDETKINIWGSDGVKYYWTRPGDVLRPYHLDLTVKHGGGGLTLWGCITSRGPGYACQIYGGAMNSEVYQHILGTTFMDTLRYFKWHKSQVYLQQDNDPKHTSQSTTKWLKEHSVRYINDWPSQSPDLNPMEHVWHQLKLQLSAYETHATSLDDLWRRVDLEWNKFDRNLCRKYIDSMPARIDAVIKAKGGHTRF